MPMPKKPRALCLVCAKEPERSGYKYCSNLCQRAYQHVLYVKKWKSGEETGLRTTGVVTNPIKKYLRLKFKNRCCLCGWSRVNQKTGLVPLVADHIDGNWKNNAESNLRLICPNCDSLSPTYAALNKGSGRKHRAISKRAIDARVFKRKKAKGA
jgi:hypothetical protein